MKQKTLALYIRLSKEDADVGVSSEKEESNSITNQRMLLYEYLKSHPEFQDYRIIEKCDDGYSGKKFDRPQFIDLMDLVRQQEINCIIVKDFSRFGRDYIEIGDYLEQLFPFLGVRFIAVNDRYDSQEGGKQTAGLEVAFKNFIYDFYSRDTSKKIRNVRNKMAKEGQFASANAPYGYLKSPEDKHKLVIDEEAAAVVREIFRLRLSGFSGNKIAAILNERKVPSPAQYALNHKRGMDWRRVNQKTAWDPTKVIAILKDERYAGNMVSLRRMLNGIYGADTPVEKDEWIRVENTHEAIISYEDFIKTQATFLVYRKSQPKVIQKYNAFTCAHCGRKLSYSEDRKKLICRYGETNPMAACYKAAYPDTHLKGAVLESLKWHFEQFVRWEELQVEAEQREQAELDTSILEKQIDTQEKAKMILYEKYRDGRLSREEYIAERSRVNLLLEEVRKQLEQLQMEREIKERGETKLNEFSCLVQKYRYAEKLTKELEQTFVEKVLVFDAEHIKITWKFQDVFSAIEAME